MTQQQFQPPQFQPPMFENPKAQAAAAKAYRKAQRPAWKKKRVILPVALIAIIGISVASSGGGSTTPEVTTAAAETDTKDAAAPAVKAPAPKPAEPAIVASSKEMIELLEGNALKAKNTYDGKQVEVSGFVGSIDASGDYFSLDPEPDALIFTGVQVQLSDKFQDQVANFEKGQAVTVTGKITGVGEVVGYSLEAASIK